MNHKEWLESIRSGISLIVLLVLFYRNIWWVICVGLPLGCLQYRRLKRKWEEERKWQLNLEFKEGLQGIAAALNAGYSIENAIEESRRDLIVLYGRESPLCWEFQVMLEQLHMNRPVESVMDEFAVRTGVEDIQRFAEIFRTARRSGGNLVSITRSAAERIGEKIEVSREIRTLIAGKQMEGHIMNIVPLGMILYFWICSPGFLDCFYGGIWGRTIMSFFLLIYITAYLLSEKICRIHV